MSCDGPPTPLTGPLRPAGAEIWGCTATPRPAARPMPLPGVALVLGRRGLSCEEIMSTTYQMGVIYSK